MFSVVHKIFKAKKFFLNSYLIMSNFTFILVNIKIHETSKYELKHFDLTLSIHNACKQMKTKNCGYVLWTVWEMSQCLEIFDVRQLFLVKIMWYIRTEVVVCCRRLNVHLGQYTKLYIIITLYVATNIHDYLHLWIILHRKTFFSSTNWDVFISFKTSNYTARFTLISRSLVNSQ